MSLILGYLADDASTDDLQRAFPDLTPEDVAACLRYARILAAFEVTA